ncbi:hypothetical protein [Pandoravirus japonicus]|uniref:F-box domain containing protein n=1 Tax=Pandoravirus japonicus TaxID=2823154 RepID=A0A811BRV5_9VIRU|nr:hypothetical protein [Pandoravirus japonicus]
MGSRRGHRHRRLQPAEQRAQAFVLVGLPIEVWDLIVGWCDIDDMRALTRTCAALRRCAWARVDAACRATHASVDAFVTLWERETSRGDRLLDALSCSLCGTRHMISCLASLFFSCVFFCGSSFPSSVRESKMNILFSSRWRWRSAPGAAQALGGTHTIIATTATTATAMIPRARASRRRP